MDKDDWKVVMTNVKEVRKSFYHQPSPRHPNVKATKRSGKCKIYTREEITVYMRQKEKSNGHS